MHNLNVRAPNMRAFNMRSFGSRATMRTIALYATLFSLATIALIVFSTTGGPGYVSESYDRYRRPPIQAKPQQHRPATGSPNQPNGQDPPISHSQSHASQWTYQYPRDARNYGLSQEQCESAFPDLYKEIDRAVAWTKEKKGSVTEDDLGVGWRGDGITRALVYDNQLYIIAGHNIWDHNHRPRQLASLHSLHRAITAYPGVLPNAEFTITDHDMALLEVWGNHTTWAYSRLEGDLAHQKSIWLMPDFGFWAWPDVNLRSYGELQRIIVDEEDEFLDKVPKIVWRGAVGPVGSKDVREGLVNAAKDQPWSDVQVLNWDNKTEIQERLLDMQSHCGYMFLAQTEGNTYSGRLKYLLNCHSIVVSHPLGWKEHFHHLMKPSGPDQNIIEVRRDFSDLPKKMEYLLKPKNLQRAEAIADNARSTFRERYLTPAAEACYWRALIRGWSSVQGFQPELYEMTEVPDWTTGRTKLKRRPRGAPFESFVIMEEVNWAVPAKTRHLCIDDGQDPNSG